MPMEGDAKIDKLIERIKYEFGLIKHQ